MPQANDYWAIGIWGRLMGSNGDYVRAQQERAAEEGAPTDAIYEKDGGGWRQAKDLDAAHSFWAYSGIPEGYTPKE